MTDSPLVTLTISELVPKIKAKEISPVELTEAALAQADRLQPTLNSFITILHEQARRQAKAQEAALMRGEYRGPLHGIPIGIKDNIATAGIRTTVGSKVLAAHVPEEDAYVVSRCKAAGAIIIGKENLEEFAAGSTSNNLHYGAVHKSLESGPHPGWLQRWRWRQCRGVRDLCVVGHRPGGVGPRSGKFLWYGGIETDLRPGEPARPDGHQLQRRPYWPHHPISAR